MSKMSELESILASSRHRRGFSLIELMVGLAVGMVATVVVVQVLSYAEGQKRSTTTGSDAQVSGSLALYAIQRDVQMAGYGFASSPSSLGCALSYSYKGTAIAGFPAALVPVSIAQGAAGAPDSIRVLSGNKVSASVPTRVIPPGYDPTVVAKATSFPVASALGVKKGDLLVAVTDATVPCGLFQATADGASGYVPRADDPSGWNATGQPATAYGDGSYLVNLGQLVDRSYDVNTTTKALRTTVFSASVGTYAIDDIQPGIVQLKALYGKCSTCTETTSGPIDSYDNVTPTTNAGWLQVTAIRVAVVARSGQYEKDAVTAADQTASGVLWDVGAAIPVTGSAGCHDTSQCLTLKLDSSADWMHYRYKVYDTVIPLRNLLWKS
jgi:type IV pilus assembly protein PilW